MTADRAAVCFECRLCQDGVDWEIVAMWGHSLRERIQDLAFSSEEEAALWIRNCSKSWAREQRWIWNEQNILGSNDVISRNVVNGEHRSERRRFTIDEQQKRKTEIQMLRDGLARLSEKIAASTHASRGRTSPVRRGGDGPPVSPLESAPV